MRALGFGNLVAGLVLAAGLTSGCGDDDQGAATSACLTVAEQFAILWEECGITLPENRQATIDEFACEGVGEASQAQVDSCLMRLGELTCANAGAAPSECADVFNAGP